MVFYVFMCRSVCSFVYGPFCHGALKLDIYIVDNILSLNISLIYILICNEMYVINSNAQSNTSVTIHRVSASNIEVFTFEVDIGVDPR